MMVSLLKHDFTHHRFFRPAVLGSSYLAGQVAALFASAGIRVRLYDKPASDDPNALAKGVIGDLLWQKPLPFSGQEAGSLIDARNYRDDWALLKEHDLVIEAHRGDLTARQGLLSRLAPGFSKDVALVSLADGLSLQTLGLALPAGLRPRFLGAHFYRPSRFMRLVELFTTSRTEQRLVEQIDGFFSQILGREVLKIDDSPNYVGNRLLVFLINSSFYHAQRLGLGLDFLEYLTTYPELAENKGIVSRIRFLNVSRIQTLLSRVSLEDKERFGVLLKPPADLQNYFEMLMTLSTQNKSTKPFRKLLSSHTFDSVLQEVIDNRDWLTLKALSTPSAQFLYAFWRDVWQYMAWVSEQTGLDGYSLDRAVRHGISWPYGFYELLLSFNPKKVFAATLADQQKQEIAYPVSQHWQKCRHKSIVVKNKATHPFVEHAVLLKETEYSRSWLYQDKVIIWQPVASSVAFDIALMNDLLSICRMTRKQRNILLIYHHGESFGRPQNWLKAKQTKTELLIAEQAVLKRLLLSLRMLPSPVLFSLSGKVYDAGMALMMQADRVICDADISWQLTTVGQGLITFGGIWFEWLRRLPAVDSYARLAQIRSVLYKMLHLSSISDVHTARKLGLLRGGDSFTLTRSMLKDRTVVMANAWLHYQDGRAVRYGQKGLTDEEFQFLAKLAPQTDEPTHYLALLKLLHNQVAGRTLSFHVFLEDEFALFNQILQQK